MKIFLIIFGFIIAYMFIGILCYWISILIDYKKSKTKRPLEDWLNEPYNSCFINDTRESNYFYFSIFWIGTLPFYIVVQLFYFIGCLFSSIIKKILKINQLDSKL
jgi:CDP-diglyceride synthetase